MRILVINSTDKIGGSAITSYRLCKGLKKFYDDVETFFSVGIKSTWDPNVLCTRNRGYEKYIERILDSLTNKFGFQYYWFPFSSKTLLQHLKTIQPDIVYLRNIHGGYFDTSLIKKLSKQAPIVWTLSDMWSFTGHCAHSFGDMSWKNMDCGCPDKSIYPAIGRDTGKWLLRRKKNIYEKSNITLVTPSKWLYSLATQSPVFQNKRIVQIYNGFDLDVFKPKDKAACRISLDIPVDAKVLMFSARSIRSNNPWKGGSDLVHILESVNNKTRTSVHLLILGDGELDRLHGLKNFVIHHIGYVKNDRLLATCYSAADLLLYPTRADNLPNVLLEAISCGTPCITADIGGCAEIIEEGVNGFVLKATEQNLFASKVMELLNSTEKRQLFSINARKSAEKNFPLKNMCKNYYKLFCETISSHQKNKNQWSSV